VIKIQLEGIINGFMAVTYLWLGIAFLAAPQMLTTSDQNRGLEVQIVLLAH
jgi:hypothetical protein